VLDVRLKHCGEGVPGACHSDGDGQGNGQEDEWRGPHGGTVDAADRDEFVDDEKE
jgi:hypothetical protein